MRHFMSRQVRSAKDLRLEWRGYGSSASWKGLQRLAVLEASDSEGEDGPVVLALDASTVILAAHNRFRLDFVLLPFECVRRGCSWAPPEECFSLTASRSCRPSSQNSVAVLICSASCAGMIRRGSRDTVRWTIAKLCAPD